jgi:hypothetical protein
MNKNRRDNSCIVASSPIVRDRGVLPFRIVIRDLGDQFVVHTEVLESDKKPWYHQGDYFSKRNDAATAVESGAFAICKAWARFEERARRSLRMDPPPSKRMAEVADIAETIIKTLLPDDEDECRDLIDDDYQVKSDIETFEHFTGKRVHPEVEGSTLGEEIEMDDIERSP